MERCKAMVLLVGMVLLCGCAPLARTSTSVAAPAPAPEPTNASHPARQVEPAPDPRLERLLAYAARSRSFSVERLAAEYAELRRAARPSVDQRIRLAILLAHPAAPFRDEARARDLLRQAARAPAGVGDLARLLQAEIETRAHLERVLARERTQRQELQHKLEQLKTIEQEIDRPAATPVVPEPE